ncbi:MAG TPA: IclR family transcriptional regulator [Noviherbaspirillum sp.]|jgi:DNA-binding IclR family transcriptional regulator|uniref:IclR family transcriptional regulator n=1 Tax=Noviherbaspirillum sp. TaxID=1926288 RepID=UPI002F932408
MGKGDKDRAAERGAIAPLGSIEKACRILKAMTDPRHSRLTDIAEYCGMEKSTAMRVLDALAREDMVKRDPVSKRYFLGPEMARIGSMAQERFDWRGVAHASLVRLAEKFEDTALLSVLSGIETVCVDVQVGSYPIQANYQRQGSRRTLGVGAGGVALLAAMSDAEREAALAQIPPRLANFPALSRQALGERIEAAQRDGYATLINAVVHNIGGAAVVIRDGGRPVAALSVTALSERITTREKELAAALKREVSIIEASLAENRPGG